MNYLDGFTQDKSGNDAADLICSSLTADDYALVDVLADRLDSHCAAVVYGTSILEVTVDLANVFMAEIEALEDGGYERTYSAVCPMADFPLVLTTWLQH